MQIDCYRESFISRITIGIHYQKDGEPSIGGRTAVAICRTITNNSLNGLNGFVVSFRTLVFATSETFWIKMVLKYR